MEDGRSVAIVLRAPHFFIRRNKELKTECKVEEYGEYVAYVTIGYLMDGSSVSPDDPHPFLEKGSFPEGMFHDLLQSLNDIYLEFGQEAHSQRSWLSPRDKTGLFF
jgi:hypothetical protein